MNKEQRVKRVNELGSKINAIVSRGRTYANRNGVTLSKSSLSRVKQMQKAIKNHMAKLEASDE